MMTMEPFVITGDFNIHVNITSDNDSVKFLDLLESMGLLQHVDFPTHGWKYSLLITRKLDTVLGQAPKPVHFQTTVRFCLTQTC